MRRCRPKSSRRNQKKDLMLPCELGAGPPRARDGAHACYVCTHTHRQLYVLCMHIHIPIYLYTYIPIYIYIYTYTNIHVYIYTCIHLYIYTSTCWCVFWLYAGVFVYICYRQFALQMPPSVWAMRQQMQVFQHFHRIHRGFGNMVVLPG